MLGVRPRSPGVGPAPWWEPQPEGAGPAKRRRLLEEPAEPEPPAPPGLPDPAGSPAAASASASVLVLAAGSAVQVNVDGVDVLLLEPEPTSVLQVSLQGHTLILIPEGLLGLPETRPAQLGDPVVVIEEGSFCAATPESAGQQEICLVEDADPEFLVTWVDAAASWEPGCVAGPRLLSPSPSPERRAAWPTGDLVHLLRPFPGSALKPLPPSPPPSPQASLQRPARPWCKARRRLF